jgi:type IV pilus assembly protein PilN
VLIVLFYYNFHLGSKIKKLNKTIAATQDEVKKYKKITNKIKEIKRKLEILEKKTDVIKKLEKNRFEPVIMMDTMSEKIVAKRMWFKNFSAKGRSVIISGVALDEKTIADFMTRLETTGMYATVNLKNIKKQVVKGSSLRSFQLECKKPQPAKKKNAAKANKKKRKRRK